MHATTYKHGKTGSDLADEIHSHELVLKEEKKATKKGGNYPIRKEVLKKQPKIEKGIICINQG